jgi:hypothetical protein
VYIIGMNATHSCEVNSDTPSQLRFLGGFQKPGLGW